ncbi:hypothetical protein VFPBJ_01035 [Purpureocillium lilacinum]|uniref:Uncharacterized protein n=1 Tax=Purpureocillium lilacinum TaxID=33203 RepID=A0A179H9P8_PURLI|nr:hypothetical protein VFPBJ_01035 [Purpureocillium lilacinum]
MGFSWGRGRVLEGIRVSQRSVEMARRSPAAVREVVQNPGIRRTGRHRGVCCQSCRVVSCRCVEGCGVVWCRGTGRSGAQGQRKH